jgi:hypothetical protein
MMMMMNNFVLSLPSIEYNVFIVLSFFNPFFSAGVPGEINSDVFNNTSRSVNIAVMA